MYKFKIWIKEWIIKIRTKLSLTLKIRIIFFRLNKDKNIWSIFEIWKYIWNKLVAYIKLIE